MKNLLLASDFHGGKKVLCFVPEKMMDMGLLNLKNALDVFQDKTGSTRGQLVLENWEKSTLR